MIRHFFLLLIIFVNFLFLFFFKEKEILDGRTIIIEPGMKLGQISEILSDEDLIRNKNFFIIWAKLNLSEKKLKYGEYKFEGAYSINKILNKLKEGKSLDRKITIVEGTTKFDLLNNLNSLGDDFKLSMSDIPENIIANTYFYKFSDNPKIILEKIVKKSSQISDRIWASRNIEISIQNISEMFILASIIEKETSKKIEKPIISGVFYNRFKKNMKLQSDPTVVYAITNGKSKMDRKLLRRDLKIKSKYNTYVNKGLPPSPICFPGIDSLYATINPSNSDYLYFVSNFKDGGHIFSSSYKQHLQNIKKVQKLRKK